MCSKRGKISADRVIIATGGMSYQKTGSTGDGYFWAEELGHTITDIRPSLVPVKVKRRLDSRCFRTYFKKYIN